MSTDLERRAMVAYCRTDGGWLQNIGPTVVEHAGLRYVVLHRENKIFAVYRVLNSGALKRLKRWPVELWRVTRNA